MLAQTPTTTSADTGVGAVFIFVWFVVAYILFALPAWSVFKKADSPMAWASSFGKGAGFTVGLIFLSWIFLAILGWGSAQYRGPAAAPGAPTPPPPA
jgi:hypothetical protein